MLAALHTGDARRRLLEAALCAPPDLDASSVPECSAESLANAGQFGHLSAEMVIKILLFASRFANDRHSGFQLHVNALEAAEDVLSFAASCRFLLWVFRSSGRKLRLEITGRCCTSVTPSRGRREGEQNAYYNQVLREEKSRFHIRLLEGALNALVCHCTGEHCLGARRAHNLIIGSPARARTEILRRAVGEERPRIKVAWRLRSRRVAAASESQTAAIVLETEEVATGRSGARAAAFATQMRRPPPLFGPAGYLSSHLSKQQLVEDELQKATSGVLVVESAPRSEATAHFEAKPTHAIALVRDGADRPLSVTRLRMSPCGEWLAVVSSTLMLATDESLGTAGRSEVRVFSLRKKEGAPPCQVIDVSIGGMARDLSSLSTQRPDDGQSHVDVWFANGSCELFVLDCSDGQRGINIRPSSGDADEPFKRKPVLHRFQRYRHLCPPGASPMAFRPADVPRIDAFARIRGRHSKLCDHSVVDSAVSNSGLGIVTIWNWFYSFNPSGYGFNVQHFHASSGKWETVARPKQNTWFENGEYTPRRCVITPHSDIVVLLLQTVIGFAVQVEVYARRRQTGNRQCITRSEEAEIQKDGCSADDFDAPFACVRQLCLSASIETPISVMKPRCSATTSPCGRFVLFVFKSASNHLNSSGGAYVIDLGEQPFARALSYVWMPALSYALPNDVSWNRAGLWLQTHTGVLLVGA